MSRLRRAPAGFTGAEWARFRRDGILVVPKALRPAEVKRLLAVIGADHRSRGVGESYSVERAVERHREFTRLIDHDAHIGRIHDVYGEATKLLLSQYFVRPPGTKVRNEWHFDGPRTLPFRVFSDRLPLRIKVGYWLTSLPKDKMGNLVFIPGSHRHDHLAQYRTHERHPRQRVLRVEPGTMILMWGGLWHRVEENESQTTRMNVFLEYGPTWVTAGDRFDCDPRWARKLSRERRILMRPYVHPNSFIKVPEADVPLFRPRAAGLGPDARKYRPGVPANLRKHRTWAEGRA